MRVPTGGVRSAGLDQNELRERKVLAPALSTIERLAWETRRCAERLVFVRLTAALILAKWSPDVAMVPELV